MGIILGPFIIFWIWAGYYSLSMSYDLLNNEALTPHIDLILTTILLTTLTYTYVGLSRFKRKKNLYAFEIPIFFTINPIAITVFFLALLANFLMVRYIDIENEYTKLIPFMMMFTVSLGTLVGFFSAKAFMKFHKIKEYY